MIYYEPHASEMLKIKWMPQAYVVLCLVNGKVYNGIVKNVGCTWERRTEKELNQTGTPNKHFLRSIQKYGRHKFHRYLLAVADTVEEIIDVEKQQILDTRSHLPGYGYNKTMGGEGCLVTPDTRRKRAATFARKKSDPTDLWYQNTKRAFHNARERMSVVWLVVNWMRTQSDAYKRSARDSVVRLRMANKPSWLDESNNVRRAISASQDPELAAKVIDLYWNKGLSSGQVAKETGRSISKIYSVIRNTGNAGRGLTAQGKPRKKVGDITQTDNGGSKRPSEPIAGDVPEGCQSLSSNLVVKENRGEDGPNSFLL